MKIKAQHSLQTDEKVPQALFYNRDRSMVWAGPVPGKWKPLFEQHGPRFFAGVEWTDNKKAPQFKTLVPEQGW